MDETKIHYLQPHGSQALNDISSHQDIHSSLKNVAMGLAFQFSCVFSLRLAILPISSSCSFKMVLNDEQMGDQA